ncbi:MAG TPA: hypothetical protein VF400_03135 [Anaeromyxobacteraceae bacterium]
MRKVALLTCLTFACATARQQVPGSDLEPPPDERIALAEPQLELWMEGTHAVDPAEEARALEASRNALADALDGRGLEAPDPEALLVVRARAVARTEERKQAQVWSGVAFVIVFVVVIIATIALSRSRSSSGPRGGPGHAVLPAGPRGGASGPAYFAPRRYAPPPPVGVFIGLNVAIPVGPPPPFIGLPPTDAWLASRGWFDGDEVELAVELQDPRTGAVRWQRTVREGIDPRDPGALGRLVDHALWGLPFGQRGR